MKVQSIEIVEDRTDASTLTGGFIKMGRYTLCNVYEDGTKSEPYPCDWVYRQPHDSVCVVIYGKTGTAALGLEKPGTFVVLRRNIRPTMALREDLDDFHLVEVVAGVMESGDEDVSIRALEEIKEEAGLSVLNIKPNGPPMFASPGYTSERLHFLKAEVGPIASLNGNMEAPGDGPWEDGGTLIVLPLEDAIAATMDGRISDMKTALSLHRLRAL